MQSGHLPFNAVYANCHKEMVSTGSAFAHRAKSPMWAMFLGPFAASIPL